MGTIIRVDFQVSQKGQAKGQGQKKGPGWRLGHTHLPPVARGGTCSQALIAHRVRGFGTSRHMGTSKERGGSCRYFSS
jgi:hypothetical protein